MFLDRVHGSLENESYIINTKVSKFKQGCNLPHEDPKTWDALIGDFGKVILKVKI